MMKELTRFQASTAVQLQPLLHQDVVHCMLVAVSLTSGTAYMSHIPGLTP